MGGNDGTGNIAERDNWQTPQWLFDKLNEQYDFKMDCCADPKNSKCTMWHTDFLNKLINKELTCWMNPPFSKASEMFDHFFKVVKKGVCIYRCDNMETKLWQTILQNATWIFMPDGRINYEGRKGKGSRFGSALIGFNVEPPKFDVKGATLIVQEASKWKKMSH